MKFSQELLPVAESLAGIDSALKALANGEVEKSPEAFARKHAVHLHKLRDAVVGDDISQLKGGAVNELYARQWRQILTMRALFMQQSVSSVTTKDMSALTKAVVVESRKSPETSKKSTTRRTKPATAVHDSSPSKRFTVQVAQPVESSKDTMPTDEVFTKIRDTLVDALGVDDDEVAVESKLEADLGAESIDFLDIVFRLEKNFNIKIPRGELFPENLVSAGDGLVKDGLVTADGLAVLRQKVPHLDVDTFAKDPKVESIKDMFTVAMLMKFVRNKLAV